MRLSCAALRCFGRLRNARHSRAKRKILLQKHNKVKQFHAPPNGKAATEVACQNRINRRCQLPSLSWLSDNLCELRLIPTVNKAQVQIHDLIDATFILFEEFRPSPRVLQNLRENICSLLAGTQPHEHTSTKNRINKSSGVTG